MSLRLTVVLALAAMAATPSGAAAATLFTTPGPAAGADCSDGEPCALATAFSQAVHGDTIVIGTGLYTGGALYADFGKALTVRGEQIGVGRPVVEGQISLSHADSHLSDVEVRATSGAAAVELSNGASADRVIANHSGGNGCAILPAGSAITNSVCVSTKPNSHSGLISSGSTGETSAHNVTAAAFYGFFATAGSAPTDPGLTIKDSIAFTFDSGGGGLDVVLQHGKTTIDRMAFNSSNITANASSSVITNTLTANPVFRAPGDYRQHSSSPTIDAGGDAAGPGELDLNGNLRKVGAHTDMGAYEFVPAPVLTAEPVSDVTTTMAQVNGLLDANGGRVYHHVEYGDTPALGSATAVQVLPAADGPTPVAIDLAGLTRKSDVHYSIVATSDGGTVSTPVATFTTAPLAPVVTTGAATDVTTAGATLHGTADTDGVAGTAHFEVTPVGGATFSTPDQTVSGGAVSAAVTRLAEGTAYSYRLVVSSTGGITSGDAQQFTTATTPPPPPPALAPTAELLVGNGSAPAQLLLSRSTISLYVTCGKVPCTVTASGTVVRGARSFGRLAAPARPTAVAAGGSGVVHVRSSKRLRNAVRRHLNRNPRARVVMRIVVVFTGADGKSVMRTLSVRVRRLKR